MAENKIKGPWIGFDLGGTKMMSLVFNKDFKIIGRERKKTKSVDGSPLNIEKITKTIISSLEISKITEKPAGIGIGVPGILDLAGGVILEAPNLGWKKMPLKEMLEKEFGCPVAVVNDVDAGVYGEYSFGAAQNVRCALGIFPGTGIGGGCVYEGNIFTGKNNSCMEIGHIPVDPDGILCGCGRKGCLETVASRLAISAASAMAIYRGEAPVLQKIAGTDISNIRSGSLAQAISSGDKVIETIVRDAARKLGLAVGGLVNILAPDIVVLGGGLVEAMPELYLTEVKSAVRSTIMPSMEKLFRLSIAKLGDDATATGAAAWAKKQFEKTA
jgi:glucokinase